MRSQDERRLARHPQGGSRSLLATAKAKAPAVQQILPAGASSNGSSASTSSSGSDSSSSSADSDAEVAEAPLQAGKVGRQSAKASFIAKVLSPVLDYAADWQLAQFVYDLWPGGCSL